MATTVCPNCKILLRKGAWELLTHCPECNAPWNIEPDANERNSRKVQIRAVIYTVLSLVPILGILFGAMGVFWGYLAIKFRHVVLGVSVMLLSGAILVCNSALAWWGIGKYADNQCHSTLEMVAGSLRAYHDKFQSFPDELPDLAKAKLFTAKGCIYGGTYFYLPPWNWEQSTISSDTFSAEFVGLKKTPVENIPAAAAKLPQRWATSMPANWQPKFYAAALPITTKTESPEFNPTTQIMVAEVDPVHRYIRMCVTADYKVRTFSPEQYKALLALPQNAVFAKLVEGARNMDEDSGIGKKAKKALEGAVKTWNAAEEAKQAATRAAQTAASQAATASATQAHTAETTPATQGAPK